MALTVEIADTPDERARGLMYREALDADSGMLFVWPADTGSGFWMKDTLIPLSIAFIDSGGVIVDIQDMEPLDETLHRSPEPYRWAVEANQGYSWQGLWEISAAAGRHRRRSSALRPVPIDRGHCA
jgi:uncharacterized membrane protein (UPF0127 family)